MTVLFSKKCELALQSVLYLSILPKGTIESADNISKQIKAPREFVSKILQSLTDVDIIKSKKGKFGGFSLAKDPKEIKLIDIITAIDGDYVFDSCVMGFPGCSDENPCPMHEKWAKLREESLQMLSTNTLADLYEITKRKIEKI
ncbi:MAG: Rrf2 family transcriptional regulator [Candidatus Kapabacteria bacterium]|nr:Rrf2 family transcriptional regulator [Candidatus Kapabacteria bacterium]